VNSVGRGKFPVRMCKSGQWIAPISSATPWGALEQRDVDSLRVFTAQVDTLAV